MLDHDLDQLVEKSNYDLSEVARIIKDMTIEDRVKLFHLAFESENIDIIKILLVNGITLNILSPHGYPILESAVIDGKNKVFDFFLQEFLATIVEYKRKSGLTLLDLAAGYNKPRIIEKLVKSGLTPSNKSVTTPYTESITRNHNESINRLAELNISPNLTDHYGNNALHYAAQKGNLELIKKFIAMDGNVRVQNREGKLPLHYAIENGHYEIAKFLIEKGSQINLKDKYGNTALHLSVQQSSDEVTKFIINNLSPSTNLTNDALTSNLNKLLLDKNNLGMNLIQAAADSGSIKNFEALFSHYSPDQEKLRELCNIAARQGHVTFVEEIVRKHDIKLREDDFAIKLINHPNKEHIEKMSSQFNQGFGAINKEGGLLSFARIKEKGEKDSDAFEYLLVHRIVDFERLLASALERVQLLPGKKLNIRVGFDSLGHWTFCDIEINEDRVDICFIDSLGKGVLIENYLPVIFKLAPKAIVSEVSEKRQNSGSGCSVMVIDDAEHMITVDRYLPESYKDEGFHGYIKKNQHPTGLVMYKDDFTDQEYPVKQVYLPLYLARTTQSTSSSALPSDSVIEKNKNIFWVSRASTTELNQPINVRKQLPHESVGEHIYEVNDVRSNQRLEHKLRRQCTKNIEFMLKHDELSLASAIREATVDRFVEKTEELKSRPASQIKP